MSIQLTLQEIGKKRHGEFPDYLFREITAEVQSGQRIVLLGTSGQGKTTLLRILSRLEKPDEGALSLSGRHYLEWKPQEWRRKVCYVAQQPVMLTGTVEANLRTVSELHGTAFDKRLAEECMAALGLENLDWSKQAADLSGGEKQRTALVRALLLQSEVLLLDEVTASLDPASKRAAERLLSDWAQKRGTALIWITHDLDQAAQVSDFIWFMDEGRLLETARAEEFFREPSTRQAKSFIRRTDSEGGVL
ncbi:ATP-binding cassette domain-containing protein [Paenibacillus sp. FJAT-26967]|uniref:ABC transporter ATP-binding protein n=1 Tax=Paenibacillus sp. FJAT-26967 TaxID=1729690 RepID=UPI000AB3BA67|nr:ATP-binding cassette domain-containing protein [Paenibacillus sp. FJAT-26967]